MFVNKYKILTTQLSGSTGYTIDVPASQNGGFVGQQEIINTKFVQTEVDKAVNIIYDYEKVRLLPIDTSHVVTDIVYKLNFLTAPVGPLFAPTTTYNLTTMWSDLTFTDNDFNLKKNSFTKSFLRLDFYDSDIATNQNFISFVTLYPKFSESDVAAGYPTAGGYSVQFKLGNTLVDRRKNGEGFSLYHFKDEIFPHPLPPKYLYMKATFNNAKTGESTAFMSTNNATVSIDDLMLTTKDILPAGSVKNNLYTRYILTRTTDGYFYQLDKNYSSNITPTASSALNTINLYEISTS